MFDFIGHQFLERSCLFYNNLKLLYEVALMFYEVKVFDSRGQLKKVVSSKKLSNRFWRHSNSALSSYETSYAKSEEWGTKGITKAEKIILDESL